MLLYESYADASWPLEQPLEEKRKHPCDFKMGQYVHGVSIVYQHLRPNCLCPAISDIESPSGRFATQEVFVASLRK